MRQQTEQLIKNYYDKFNAKDNDGFLALLSDDVIHEMDECYNERAYDIAVMVNEDGERAAAEFMLDGTYLKQDGTLPPANGQTYTLRVGAFFEIRDGKVARITNHYNMKDWLRQIS
jgi:steroid delta-isomerase-like uncharacterized protein